jgi:negative regulator of sigma E activity
MVKVFMGKLSQTELTPCGESISALSDGEITLAELDHLRLNQRDGAHWEQIGALAKYQLIGRAMRGESALAQVDEVGFVRQWREGTAPHPRHVGQPMAKSAANDARWKWAIGFASFAFLTVSIWFAGEMPLPSPTTQQMVKQQSVPTVTFAQAREKRNLVLTQSSQGAVWRDPELDAVLLQQRVTGDVEIFPTTVRNAAFQTRVNK